MNWIKFSEKYPEDNFDDEESILITDGKEVWSGWMDHNRFYFRSRTLENESDIERRLTHWIKIKDVELPKDSL